MISSDLPGIPIRFWTFLGLFCIFLPLDGMGMHIWQLILKPERRERECQRAAAPSVQASELIAKSAFPCHLTAETVTNGRKNVFMPLGNRYIDASLKKRPFCPAREHYKKMTTKPSMA